MQFDAADLENRFAYHKAEGNKITTHALVRGVMKDAAFGLYAYVPQSRELSLALSNLEQAMFWANAAVARMDSSGQRL